MNILEANNVVGMVVKFVDKHEKGIYIYSLFFMLVKKVSGSFAVDHDTLSNIFVSENNFQYLATTVNVDIVKSKLMA